MEHEQHLKCFSLFLLFPRQGLICFEVKMHHYDSMFLNLKLHFFIFVRNICNLTEIEVG